MKTNSIYDNNMEYDFDKGVEQLERELEIMDQFKNQFQIAEDLEYIYTMGENE